jgi:hypothetical protein
MAIRSAGFQVLEMEIATGPPSPPLSIFPVFLGFALHCFAGRDDKALHTALDLILGITKNSAYPPNAKSAVRN